MFIAYSQDDFFDAGIGIRNYLSQRFPDSYVYIDQIKPKGKKWRVENEQELRISNLVILIITPAAVESEEVKREIKIALEEGKTILPCKDDNLELEWIDLPFGMGDIDGLEFESEEVLKRRLFRTIKKIRKEISEKILAAMPPIKSDSILVQTDKKLYEYGETIVVSGEVRDLIGQAVSVMIISPNGNIVSIAQVDVSDDKTFSTEITAGGTMKFDGTYTVSVTYGGPQRTAETTFDIGGLGETKSENIIKLPLNSSNPEFNKLAEPETLTVQVGDKVRWINEDAAAHTITSGNRGEPDGIFDSSLFMSGNSFEVTFMEKGTYKYFCMVHPWKECTIIVQ